MQVLGCGDRVGGDSADPNSGHTTVIDGYPVAPGSFDGPEIAWEFIADEDGEVTWRLDDPTPTEVDHDLFVLAGDGPCRSDRALERGHNSVTFEVFAGERYYLLIDGFDGDAGPFEAEVVCEGDPDEPPPPAPSVDPCVDVSGLWDTDPLEVVAACGVLVDGAVPDAGWFGAAPSHPLEGAALCLARGVFGLNGHPYYVLSGTVDPVAAGLPDDLVVYSVEFVGADDGSSATEGAAGVDLHGESLGTPIIDAGDFFTEAQWRADHDTLLFQERVDGWGIGDEELIYSALLDCTEWSR